jgi:Outer membrane protein beta-barrel domain
MKRHALGLIGAFLLALVPAPAQAQGDFIKDKLKNFIEKAGIYVSMSSRSSIDDDVDMGPSIGIGYGSASRNPRTGRKIPFSFSSYSGDLETDATNATFGRFKSQQIMSGIGYQWVRGKTIYSTQLGVGFAFNKVTLDAGAAPAFGVSEPVSVDVSNSFVVRPQAKVEYFLHRKVSVRGSVSYTYTDPDVVVSTATQQFMREWNPHHVHASVAIGFFPFRK